MSFFRDNLLEEEGPEWYPRMHPAVRALGEVEDERVVPLLQEFLEGQSDKKALKAGVDALRIRAKTLREREAIQALVQASQADNRSLAQRAAGALVKVGQDALIEIEKALMEMEQGSKA